MQPLTPVRVSADLSIKLEHTHTPMQYLPGDTIIGTVSRTAPGLLMDAQVTVAIHGNARARVLRGGSEGPHSSWFNALSTPIEPLILHAHAPLQVPFNSAGTGAGEGVSWEFALTIPEVGRDIRTGLQKDFSEPSGADELGFFAPPASFEAGAPDRVSYGTYSEGPARSVETGKGKGFIEYVVQARIDISTEYRGKSVKRSHTATAPFKLGCVRPGLPITDFKMKMHTARDSIAAYRLIPGMDDLSFKQKTRQAFLSSSVPRITFDIGVSVPRVLQVGNSARIPIVLVIQPVGRLTSDVVLDVPQEIVIKSFALRMRLATRFQAGGIKADQVDGEVDLIGSHAIAALQREVRVTVTPTSGEGDDRGARVDLGELLDFRLKREFHPSFQTYNVTRMYDLMWEIEGHIAGEDFKLGRFRDAVEVLPRAYVPLGQMPRSVAGPGPGADEVLPGYAESNLQHQHLPAYEV
ncbi:hypothetical protein BJX99DRAFT_223007 [Aspergillus californicus]